MKSGTPEPRDLPLGSAPVTDHTPPTLTGAARALRTSLAQLRSSPLLISPTLRAAVPQLRELLECLEDAGDRLLLVEGTIGRVTDRLASLEAQVRQLQGMGGAVDAWNPTLEKPGVMPAIDYDVSNLGPPRR